MSTSDEFGAAEGSVSAIEAVLPQNAGQALHTLRAKLLDIGKRNRLIHTPRSNRRAKHLEIIDELSDEIFKILAHSQRQMSFLPIPESDEVNGEQERAQENEIYVPPDEDEELEDGEIAARHVDTKLQTSLKREPLQKKLKTLYVDSQTMEEEQGVNVLYLAIGFLKWFESESSDVERFAPLILLPVALGRDTVKGRFKLSIRDDDLEPNLSLRALLESDFEVKLPDFPESPDWVPSQYFASVEKAISQKPRWELDTNAMVLGFYSYAKFLMWRDLDQDTWPEDAGPFENQLIQGLLAHGFDHVDLPFDGEENLDDVFQDPRDLGHILDADSSQTQVIASALDGHSLVVQGPPGTGKSQTIANIIAACAREGKRILFVAEKMAALEVVYRRLDQSGLGPLCLELHSRKANKKAVLEELGRTIQLGAPTSADGENYGRLKSVRDELNEISNLLHTVYPQSMMTPFGVVGEIARLKERGVSLPNFTIDQAPSWSPKQYEDELSRVSRLAELTTAFGPEFEHRWRGVRNRLTPMDRERLTSDLSNAIEVSNAFRDALDRTATAIGGEPLAKLSETSPLRRDLLALEQMPAIVPELVASDTIARDPLRARQVIELVQGVAEKRERLEGLFVDSAFEMAWAEDRAVIAAHGKSWFRFLNGGFKVALAKLRSVNKAQVPKELEERLSQLDQLLALQKSTKELEAEETFGRAAFGEEWRGQKTQTDKFSQGLDWIVALRGDDRAEDQIVELVNKADFSAEFGALAAELDEAQSRFETCLSDIVQTLELDLPLAFDADQLPDLDLKTVFERLSDWDANLEDVENWFRLSSAAQSCSEAGSAEIRQLLGCGDMAPEHAEGMFAMARAEALWRLMLKETPTLSQIDGRERSSKVENFKNLDRKIKQLTAHEIALTHHRAIPRGSSGQMGILRGEIAKKRRHMALRRLMERAGDAIVSIKPILLMSPLSVAQFLPPGKLQFDVLIIDEASQVRPEDAIGAIARCEQAIIVGDTQQLPPTSFFDRQIEAEEGEDELEDNEEIIAMQAGQVESILKLCDARSMPGDTLKWHYRSNHPSLIEVSNHHFYDNKLVYPPSPDYQGDVTGLTFHKVDGVYDRGGKRNNSIEAQAVVDAIITHFHTRPDQSLGAVTFSVSQRDTIENQLEYVRAQHPELEPYFSPSAEERFFVKNLENVQGDERDVIFISVGYGRDKSGYMSQSFGPVSSEGGERRLNVLFSRARDRCVVFSSITSDDIKVDGAKNAGRRVLKSYLKFAETGDMDIPKITGREMESPFEEAVASAIRKAGFDVEAQVGSAGFLVDLAVFDPEGSGNFVLGIECDGARYHSSRWARERDRLRQEVLESKGWTIHRVWSTDWFQQPEQELRKILEAIDRARSAPQATIKPDNRAPSPTIERDTSETIDAAGSPHLAAPYREAVFEIDVPVGVEIHEANVSLLKDAVLRIVEIEGPIHEEEVGRRLSRLWGLRRAGQRIQNRVKKIIATLVKDQKLAKLDANGSFVEVSKREGDTPIRDRSSVASSTLRRLETLPPSEIDAAIEAAVALNVSMSSEEIAVDVARMFGFRSTSADFQSLVAERIGRLYADGSLNLHDDQYSKPSVV